MPSKVYRFWPLLIAAFILTLFPASCVRDARFGDGARPNVILIVTDDQNADTLAFMPTLQRYLVDEGTTFTSAYAPTPLCCPGRASILRGQYAHNHGVRSNDGVNGGFPKFFDAGNETSTLATWLQNAGYRTALVGKYFNAYPEGLVPPEGFSSPGERHVPPGWDEWYGLLDVPLDERTNPYGMYGYPLNRNGRVVRYGNRPDDYLTDTLAELATDFVEDNAGRRQPFFLYLAPTAPHLPAIPAPRHRNRFEGLQAPRSPSFDEAEMADKPAWLRNRPALTPEREARLDETYRKQAQMLLAVDEMLSALLDALEAKGELDQTYVVFTSDHGLTSGEHRLVHTKLVPYGASARVPLVVRGPGVAAGRTVDTLALLTDIAPTVTELTNAATPAFVDGRSLAPWLGKRRSGEAIERRHILHEFWPREGFPLDVREESARPLPLPPYSALRSARYLYVEYDRPDARRERELYDLRRDPFELDNIARTAAPSLLDALSSGLEALRTCKASACRRTENRPL